MKVQNILKIGTVLNEDRVPGTRNSGRWTQVFWIHNLVYKTWDPWSNSEYLIAILIYFWWEKAVVIDDNFPQCVLGIMTQENENSET